MKKNRVKDKLNSFSYTRLYGYLGIILGLLIVYIFVISKYDPQSQIINSDKTVTAQIETKEKSPAQALPEQESQATTDSKTEDQEAVATSGSNDTTSSNSKENTEANATVATEQPVATEQAVAQVDDKFPANSLNAAYAGLKHKKIVIKKGSSLSSLFNANKLPVGDLYAMLDHIGKANKPRLERLDANDYILVKQDEKNKIVALAIYNKNDQYIGQVVLADGKYAFIK